MRTGKPSTRANTSDKVYYITIKDLNAWDKNMVITNRLNIFELSPYSVHATLRMRYGKFHALGYSLAIRHNEQTALIIYNKK